MERVEELGGRIEELKAFSVCKIWTSRVRSSTPGGLEVWGTVGVNKVRGLLFLDVSMLLDIDLFT